MKKLIFYLLLFGTLTASGQIVKQVPVSRAPQVVDATARANAQKAQDSVTAVKARYNALLPKMNDSVDRALYIARKAFRTADSLAALGGGGGTVQLQKKDILHDMTAAIEGAATANDYVVELNYNRNWPTYQNLIYNIQSTTSYFKVESGIVKVNTQSIPAGNYSIKFSVSDSVYTDTATLAIQVIDPALCYYVDPTSTGTGVGTKANPYKTMGFSLSDNRKFFFKRGTTTTSTSSKSLNSGNMLGAYGTGARPIIRNTAASNFMIQNYAKTGITLRDIEFEDAGSLSTGIIYAQANPANFNIINCKIHGGSGTFQGVRIFAVNGGSIADCEIYNTADDNVFIGGITAAVGERFKFVGNYHHHANLNYATSGNSSGGDNLQFGSGSENRRVYIAYNYFDRSHTEYKHNVVISCNADAAITDVEMTVEYNVFMAKQTQIASSPQNNLSIQGIRNAIIRYNTLWYGHRNIFDYEVDQSNDVKIYGNLMVEGKTAACQFNGVNTDNLLFYNNTMVNCGNSTNDAVHATIIMNGNMSGSNFRNNIFYNTNATTDVFYGEGTITENYNIMYPNNNGLASKGANSSNSNPLFVKGNHSNYEIGTNSPAYRSGQAITGYTTGMTDIFGTAWYSTPSRGYKEK